MAAPTAGGLPFRIDIGSAREIRGGSPATAMPHTPPYSQAALPPLMERG